MSAQYSYQSQEPQGAMKGQPVVSSASLSQEEIMLCSVLARIAFRCLKEGNPRVMARFAQAPTFSAAHVFQEDLFLEAVPES